MEHEPDQAQPRPPRTRLVDALETSRAALEPADQDAALVAYLDLLARELDGAAALAARAARVAQDVYQDDPDGALYERVHALEAALNKRTALDKIGARFHAGLVELLGTPRARGVGKPAGGGKEPAATPDWRAQFHDAQDVG